MRGHRSPLFLAAVLSSFCLIIQIASAAGHSDGVRLTVDLQDGARLIGKSADATFKFQSDAFGKMNLSLDKIRTIESSGQTNSVRLTTSNSDMLAVQFAMKDIRLETEYGEINVPVRLIKHLRVSTAGKSGRPAAGLLGSWSGENNTIDSVSGRSAVNQNATFTDGVVGKAFSFAPGAAGYYTGIQITDEPAYALTNSLTIEGWIRPRGNGNVIFYRGDHRPGLDPYALSMRSDDRCLFSITDQEGHSASVETTIPYYQWTHVAGTLDGESGTMKIFTNASLAGEIKTDIRPFAQLLADQSPGVGIGNVNDGGNNFPFVGDIDEIGLYGRALSSEEIQGIFNENVENAGKRAGPITTRSRFPRGLQWNTGFPGRDSAD